MQRFKHTLRYKYENIRRNCSEANPVMGNCRIRGRESKPCPGNIRLLLITENFCITFPDVIDEEEYGKQKETRPRTYLGLISSNVEGLLTLCSVALAARYTYLIVAGTAIDGAIILGQEWHLRLHSALGANNRVHFARAALRPATHPARRIATRCSA